MKIVQVFFVEQIRSFLVQVQNGGQQFSMLPVLPVFVGWRLRCVERQLLGEKLAVGRRPNPLINWGRLQARNWSSPHFDIPDSLRRTDDTWPDDLKYWMIHLELGRKDPEEIAFQLEKWYPNETRLVQCAKWLRKTKHSYPERRYVYDMHTNWVAITSVIGLMALVISREW